MTEFDFSLFPNLKKVSLDYNNLENIIWGDTSKIEEISWWGVNMDKLNLDLSKFPSLRKVNPGQDNLKILDLSNNPLIEEISFSTSHSLQTLLLPKDCKLKRINLQGVLIPFVDLTSCKELQSVNINYWNTFRKREDVYGPGYPRPFIFVNEDFDEKTIPDDVRENAYYCYILIRVGSSDDDFGRRILEKFKNPWVQYQISEIYPTHFGDGIAKLHYKLRNLITELKRSCD